MAVRSFAPLSDNQLCEQLAGLALRERTATADIVAGLAEFDRRRLYLNLGYQSIYAYCGDVLHMSEDAAYKRVEVARASLRFPQLLEMLQDGRLSITTASMLSKCIEPDNVDAMLREAAFGSKRDVELLIARRHPGLPLASALHRLTPISDTHYRLHMTISSAARERLQQVQDLLRHRLPNGDPASIFEHALEVLHASLLRRKAAQVKAPRQGKQPDEVRGRVIPAAVQRAVWRRDQGACAFVASDGRRCGSTSGLEFHHVQPFAVGGMATASNIELRCRAHNRMEWTRHLDGESTALERAADQ